MKTFLTLFLFPYAGVPQILKQVQHLGRAFRYNSSHASLLHREDAVGFSLQSLTQKQARMIH